jgi:hypothetical protein
MVMANNLARAIMALAFVTGPVFTQMLAAQYMDTYKFEWCEACCCSFVQGNQAAGCLAVTQQ